MACKTCGKNRAVQGTAQNVTLVNAKFIDFTELTTERASIRAANKNYSILSPLVKIKPPMGYGINVLVKEHKHQVTGTSPQHVVANIIQIYKDNGIEVSDRSAWFNANIYWLGQLSVKHGYTTVANLMAMVSKPTSIFAKPTPVVLVDPDPTDWGSNAWGFLGAFIATSDSFTIERFHTILNTLEDMLNDSFIGCPDCAEHFALAIDIAQDVEDPVENQLEAANWMFRTINEIRTRQERTLITWENIVTKYRWENL